MGSHTIGVPLVRLRRTTAAVACVLASACGGDSSSAPQNDAAARAATVFTQLADSIVKSGGDSGIANAYGSLGDAVRKGGRVSPVTITVDGVATPFMATAQENVTNPACPLCAAPPSPFVLRSFIAWQTSDPRRVVQVSSEADGDSIGAYLTSAPVSFTGRSASLVYLDGKGGAYFGTSGSQKFSIAPTNVPCLSRMTIQIYPAPPLCMLADFVVAFSAKAEPSAFLAARNPATGTHTFAMAAQSVAGARLQYTASTTFIPPIDLLPRAPLGAALGIVVDSLVSLTLTVTNAANTPASVLYSSGQHSDFTIYDGASGAQVWRAGMGVFFSQVVSTDTVPAKAQRVFTAQWKPTKKGTFVAAGSLVSRSHVADAKAQFTVP